MSSTHEDFSRRNILSAAKRALLDKYLQGKVIPSAGAQTIPRRPEGPAPLSFIQERLWFLEQLAPGSGAYHIPAALRLRGRLKVAELRRAFSEVVRRHEVLRTTFTLSAGQPMQVVESPYEVAIPVVDLSYLPEVARERALMRELLAQAGRPFDLERGPPWRVGLWYRGCLGAEGTGSCDEEYKLLFVCHHIVFDGWSVHVLVREVAALYSAYLRGQPTPLLELPMQYADYAYWQRKQREVIEQGLSYWKGRLAGAPQVLDLPTDRARPLQQSYRGSSYHFTLSSGLTTDLKQLSQRQGATLFMLLLAAFKVLLHRYSGGQRDLCVGTPTANRIPLETEGLIGCFVNTLVLRTELSGNPRFTDFLAQVRGVCLGAQAYPSLPFERLVDELQPVRELGRSPLIQVLFILQNAPPLAIQLDGLAVSPLPLETGSAKFDLTLEISDADQTLVGQLEYNTDVFDEDRVARMAGHFQDLLKGILADPGQRLSELPLLTKAERRQVLLDWNATAVDYPHDPCIHQLFEAQVEKTPQAVAVVFEDAQLGYAEINARANQLAHYLRTLGVGPEVLVGLCVERSLEMIVGLLGILKAGGAYVPFDPDYPKARLAHMLKQAKPRVVLTQQRLAGFLPAYARRLCLDADCSLLAKHGRSNLPNRTLPANLAYVLYTSGSTGQPKGVGIPHAGLRNRLLWMQEHFELNSTDRILQKTPYTFDVSGWEFFWPLLTGGRLVIASPDDHKDPLRLLTLIERYAVTTLHFVPSMLQTFLGEVDSTRCGSIKRVICSGEALTTDSQRRFFKSLRAELHNLYGPTEASVDVTAWMCQEGDNGATVPIGRPIANTEAYVLDPSLDPVPVRVPGGLYLGGIQLARGYLNRPDLTAERFIPNPFGTPGGRLYRTGDRARYRPDGNIEYLGRIDHQVKIRGCRIELGEIEARLVEHPAVRAAVVLAREVGPRDKRLIAYVVGNDIPPPVEVLRTYLQATLPEYMVPLAFVFMEELPLTPSGKVDRKALPNPDLSAQLARQYVAPRTPTEEVLARVWAEVLGVERVGVHDNFFELGGHSLLAMALIERLRQQGLQADVRALFTTPTVAGLALAVGSGVIVEVPPNRIPPQSPAITPAMLPLVALEQVEIDRITGQVPGGAENIQDIYPLAPLQEGILFHHLMATEGDAYLLPSLLAFDTRKRLDEFVSALQAVIQRHDILRTAVVWQGLPDPVQVVWREAPLVVEDVTFDAEVGDTAAQLRARFDPRRFRLDIRQAPLVRAFTGHDAVHQRWLLLLLSHHLATDHTTLELILEEVLAHRSGQVERLSAPLPFRNFVAQARLGVSAAEHETFFREMLGDVDEPTAPFGLLNVQGDGSGIEQAQRDLDPSLVRRLRACARTLGVSVASLCHLAFAEVLARVSGLKDVVFGTVLFGRLQGGEGADRVAGMFINTLPLRIKLGEESVKEAVQCTHIRLGELLRHEHAPLSLAQRCSAVPTPAPLFSALFNYRYSREDEPAVPAEATRGWEGIELLDSEERTNYPLSLDVDDLGKGFRLTAQVQSPIEPQRLCGYMHTALKGIIDALETVPDTSVQAIDVLPELERRQLLIEWNATAAEDPQERCIHQLFEAQVERMPEAVAVLFEGVRISYRELNARANRLAWGLKARGIGAESVVAIACPHSFEQVLAVLGILKAGAAYLALDPDQPRARWAQMIEDARPCALLVAARWRDRFLSEKRDCMSLDAMLAAFAGRCEEDLGIAIAADNLAYVLYTSGSTGRPKGAAITHGGLSNRIRWGIARFGWGPDDVILHRTALSFDVAAWELFGALAAGARLVIASSEVRRDPQALVELTQSQGITWLEVVPALLQALLETPDFGACRTLRGIGCGGEALSPALLAEFRSRSSVPLYNFYGPTEATIDATLWGSTEGTRACTVPIGRPIGNTRVYIVDRWLNPVPVGVVGELYIGGVGLARGYLHRGGATAEWWVPDPFGPAGSRLYRTGDRARYRPDGNIEFSGRIDHQVKLRGYRIELGEIEAWLGAHPEVREVCVLLRQDSMDEKRLVAYVVRRETVTEGELRRYLKEALPEYMIPVAFVFLDALPLTPNGKVDRKSLPAPGSAGPLTHPYVAPRTPAEAMLAGIWTEVLGVERVGIHDNFFALGGHSLVAVGLMQKIRQRLHTNISLVALFQAPTVAELASHIESEVRVEATSTSLIFLRRGTISPALYCIHTGTGHARDYQPLISPLGGDRIVYGIQMPAFLDPTVPTRSMNSLAGEYAELLLKHSPGQPFLILGWSLGGLIALSVAAKLEQKGAQIGFLGILDTDIPRGSGDSWIERFTPYLHDSTERARLHGLTASERHALETELKPLPPAEQPAYLARWGQERGYWFKDAPPELLRLESQLWRHTEVVEHSFALPQLDAPLHVWWASDSLDAEGRKPTDWSVCTHKRVIEQVVDGDHGSIIRSPRLHHEIRQAIDTVGRLQEFTDLQAPDSGPGQGPRAGPRAAPG